MHFQAITDETQLTRRLSDIDLSPAFEQTHGPIDPARDGTYARINRILRLYSASVATGTIIGAGGAVIANHVFKNTEKNGAVNVNHVFNNTEKNSTVVQNTNGTHGSELLIDA